MNKSIKDRLTLFTNNVQAVKRDFSYHESGRLAALLYTLENKAIDRKALKASHGVIKNEKGVFSAFRGSMSLVMAAMLSFDGNSGQKLAHATEVYDMLKAENFRASSYLAVAACLIATDAGGRDVEPVVQRARQFYDGMKDNNWRHTGKDDYIFAAMLGLSDIDVEAGVERIHELYTRLKPEFRMAGAGSVQGLSQLLTLCKASDEELEHLLSLRNNLKSCKIKLDRMHTLPALYALSLLPMDDANLVYHIMKSQYYLQAQNKSSLSTISAPDTLMFASAIISSVYSQEMNDKIMAAASVRTIKIINIWRIVSIASMLLTIASLVVNRFI